MEYASPRNIYQNSPYFLSHVPWLVFPNLMISIYDNYQAYMAFNHQIFFLFFNQVGSQISPFNFYHKAYPSSFSKAFPDDNFSYSEQVPIIISDDNSNTNGNNARNTLPSLIINAEKTTNNLWVEESSIGSTNITLETQIEGILQYFIEEFGDAHEKCVRQERTKYSHSSFLLDLFDSLTRKYVSADKAKEDITRFILRKAITWITKRFRNEQNIPIKKASMIFCERYFDTEEDHFGNKIKANNEEEVLNFLLPYKKNSRNKTANASFIKEIFASKAFYNDYQEFLLELDDILEEDSRIRFIRFKAFLLKCLKLNHLDKVQKYLRPPWLKSWLKEAKKIAYDLLNAHTLENLDLIPKEKRGPRRKTKRALD